MDEVICKLVLLFDHHMMRNVVGGPSLGVWMRIARPHHRAAVFEDLNMLDLAPTSEFVIQASEHLDHSSNTVEVERSKAQVVAR